MTPADHLRRLLSPGADRWRPMLIGLALAGAAAGAAVLIRDSAILSMAMTFAALASWLAGACAMVGYLRWFYSDSLRQAERDKEALARRHGDHGDSGSR